MISQLEAVYLIESEFPQLTKLYQRSTLSSDIYKSIQRLLDFSRKAVLDYNLNLSPFTQEKKFWYGCKSCVNYQTLLGKNDKNCFCTAMLYTPDQEEPQEDENECETEHNH